MEGKEKKEFYERGDLSPLKWNGKKKGEKRQQSQERSNEVRELR